MEEDVKAGSSSDKFIVDNYNADDVSSFTYGKKLKPYGKFMILEVSRYMVNSKAHIFDQPKYETLKKAICSMPNLSISNIDKEFERVEKELKVHSGEGIMSYLFLIYHPSQSSNQLIYQLFLTFGKVRKMESISSWYDNFRLNGLCMGYNLVMWKRNDRKGLYTVERNPMPINDDEKASEDKTAQNTLNGGSDHLNYGEIKRIFVGPLRSFIIEHGYYQDDFMNGKIKGGSLTEDLYEDETLNVVENENSNTSNTVSTNENITDDDEDVLTSFYGASYKAKQLNRGGKRMSDKEVCDACYEHYPFSFGGAHGCDIFEGDYNVAPNLEQIQVISKHYPSLIMGWILNTATYAGGSGGQHWVAFAIKNSHVYLICSQGSHFDVFDDRRILKRLNELGYGKSFNPLSIQSDGFSCGMFSSISLYLCLCFDCDVERIVNSIQKDGKGLVQGKSITDFTHVLTGTPK